MDNMTLNENEQRLYSELFGLCDVENTGKAQVLRVSELFCSSGIRQDSLNQIFELCGAKRLGHFGRSQFYIALKLVAAAQTGLPVMMESINSGRELPLPQFGKPSDGDGRRPGVGHGNYQHHVNEHDAQFDRVSQQVPPPGQLPPPPGRHTRSHTAPGRTMAFEGQPLHIVPNQNIDSNTRSPPFSPQETSPPPPEFPPPTSPGGSFPPSVAPPPPPGGPVSPGGPGGRQKLDSVGKQHTAPAAVIAQVAQGASNNLQNSERPDQGKMGKGWASFEDENQGLITQENKEWAHFTDSGKNDTSSISSDQESVDDVWSITDEQREYYVNQFKTMQPDVTGVIHGVIAKEFFEKSKLAVQELSKIWHMSDVNRDGALSLEEFCTAMHLVVLRRNDIELPDHLPPSLMPYVPFANPEEPFASDLPPGSTLKRSSPTSPVNPSQQWSTTFALPESPTSSSVSSPGTRPTPVNFEFKPITADSDSKIVHPVPLRMSPDGQPIPLNEYDGDTNEMTSPTVKESSPAFTDSLVDLGTDTVTISNTNAQLPQNQYNEYVPTSRPRPTPKKSQSVPGPNHEPGAILLPPPTSQDTTALGDRPTSLALGGEVPPPPPRHVEHTRSSSIDKVLDYNEQGHGQYMAPPAVPPRPTAKDTAQGADLYEESQNSAASQKSYKERSSSLDDMDASTIKSSLRIMHKHEGMDKKDLQAAVRKQKEQNVILSRLNNELNQELQEVMEQRIALEIQLEHLRPFHS